MISSPASLVPKWIEFGYPVPFKATLPPPKSFKNHKGARVEYQYETMTLLKEYEEVGAIV